MRESHACGSRLTDNSECIWLKTDLIEIQLFFDIREVVRTSSELFNKVRVALGKSFLLCRLKTTQKFETAKGEKNFKIETEGRTSGRK